MYSAVAEALPMESYAVAAARETERDAPVWTEEIITPEQFFTPAKETALAWSGERKLLFAVLQDAVDTFFRYRNDPTTRGQRLFRETHEWFCSRDRSWLFSFVNICDQLYIDDDYIRRGLKQYHEPAEVSAVAPPRQQRRTRHGGAHLAVVRGGAAGGGEEQVLSFKPEQ